MNSYSPETDEESDSFSLHVKETDTMSDTYTMFVLSMIMASVLAIPVIIGTTQAAAMWRLLKKI